MPTHHSHVPAYPASRTRGFVLGFLANVALTLGAIGGAISGLF